MANHLIPISPPVHTTISEPGGGTSPGLLLALRWNDDTGETEVFVATRHHGVRWLARDEVLEAWSE
jgi:hypothetical protein